MSEEAFLMNLLDFSNLLPKKNDTSNFNLNLTSQKNILKTQHQNHSKTDLICQTSTKTNQNQPINTNEKLLKSFNSLRQKLTQTNRQNIALKQNLTLLQKQIDQKKQNETFYINQIHQLTKKINHYEQQSTQFKLRMNMAKQTIIESEIKNQQIQKSKLLSQKLIDQNKKLKQELKISMELSLHQKIELQQEITTLKLQKNQLAKSADQAQNKLYKKNNDLMHLENQYKKLKILYDQQLFLKNVNGESLILKQENQELKLLNDELTSKLKKQKNKKYQLQTQLLNLQEKVRLFGTKTDIYQGELETALKKIQIVTKQNYQNKKHANQALNQKLTWQEKFLQTTVILEQLISRVKRDLIGDAVQLAKICQFRLNKLKNDEKIDFKQKNIQKRSKSSSAKKIRSSSKRKMNHLPEKKQIQKDFIYENQIPTFSNTQTIYFLNSQLSKQDHSKTVLKEKQHQNIRKNEDNFTDIKKRLFDDQGGNVKPNLNNPSVQINLEAKIRKERELMERKLRQKILYHKIQDTPVQSTKNKLRQEYFNIDLNF